MFVCVIIFLSDSVAISGCPGLKDLQDFSSFNFLKHQKNSKIQKKISFFWGLTPLTFSAGSDIFIMGMRA